MSLFKLLSETHPEAMTILEHQYRMNEDIMYLSNTLVYDGMLKCGNESVANRALQIPDGRAITLAKPWVRDVLSERYLALIYFSNRRYKVVFCDTDRVPALETKRGDRTTNEVEAALIKQVPLTLHVWTNQRRWIHSVRVVFPPHPLELCPYTDLSSNSSRIFLPLSIPTLRSTQQTDSKAATKRSSLSPSSDPIQKTMSASYCKIGGESTLHSHAQKAN